MWLFGYGSSNAVSVVEQHDAVVGAVGAAGVVRDAEEIEGSLAVVGAMPAGPKESDVVRGLKQLLDEVKAGNVNNEVKFKEMQERIEV